MLTFTSVTGIERAHNRSVKNNRQSGLSSESVEDSKQRIRPNRPYRNAVKRRTVGRGDAAAPTVDYDVLKYYAHDPQSLLLLIAILWTISLWRRTRYELAFVITANLICNIAFFLTHPLFTPYYMVPVAALSLWTLVFAELTSGLHVKQLGGIFRRVSHNSSF